MEGMFFKTLALLFLFFYVKAVAFTYHHLSDKCFTSIHIITVDPKENKIEAVRAQKPIKRETVLTLAHRHHALAAINGGFWKKDGTPAGILKIGKCWHGTPIKPRAVIGWSQGGQKVILDQLLTNHSLTETDDIEVIPTHTPSEEWKDLEHIVGGTPLLITKGTLIADYSSEETRHSFLINKHPRTAIGIKENGDWVFVVVDGRFSHYFGGMTIPELAEFMYAYLGCVEALNLDGGGSSTMVIDDAVVNYPCGSLFENEKYVEAVSDAILIFPANLNFGFIL